MEDPVLFENREEAVVILGEVNQGLELVRIAEDDLREKAKVSLGEPLEEQLVGTVCGWCFIDVRRIPVFLQEPSNSWICAN